MRVLLVGSAAERASLRARINGTLLDVAGEFASLAAARASRIDADMIVMTRGDPEASDAPFTVSPSKGARPGGVDAHDQMDERDQFEERLTAREVQVVELLAEGLPNKAIAARLGISDQTVKFHLASIASKLGAANRTDTVRRAVRRGLIDL